jgi:hypothetical protein
VTLGFDDNTVDQFAVSSLLRSLGLRAVFYVNSGRLDVGDPYMTAAQVRILQARGNEIGGHTVFHLHLSEQDAAEQQRQICADRSRLLSLGLRVSTLAYPFGDLDVASPGAAQKCGYTSARTSGGVSCLDCDVAEPVPPADLFRMRSVSGVNRTTTAEQLMVAVRRAQAVGGWLQLVFHHLCTAAPCVSNGIQAHQFEAFVRWLDSQRRAGALAVSTVRDVLGGEVKPAVSPLPATVTQLRITNASLEAPGPTPNAPRCFALGTAGDDNVFSTRRVADHHEGGSAQEVVVTKVSGGVKLQSSQDLGSCAPPITPGHGYRVGLWYKSTAPIAIVAYSRRPTGGYSSLGASPTFAASSRWRQAVWTTNGAPDTANLAISVGALFRTVGTYLIDDFSIADAGPTHRVSEAPPVDTDSHEGSGQGPGDLFVPSDTAPAVPAGPTAPSMAASQRHGWELALEVAAALAIMWGLVVALDRRFGQLHRGTAKVPLTGERHR